MATEASKTNALRSSAFFKTYLSGRVIDIGAGDDPVVPHAEIFDQHQGDANHILNYRDAEQYDAVHSSHCLEHMHNPKQSLQDWWQLVKPGGYMITVVPHEDLYEQFNWPSIFNGDHKASFRIGTADSWSPVSIDILAESQALPKAEIIAKRLYDEHYDYDLLFPRGKTPKNHRRFLNRQISSIARRIKNRSLRTRLLKFQLSRGYPIDQTAKSDALAQIEIVVRKKN
ncbi:MAG: class I SAM-dependent methyltransferase [Candidatus Puniceispirillales bacterium]